MEEIKMGYSQFYIGESEENALARITFFPCGEDKIIIDHTYVSDALRGQGIAKKLLDKAVEYARCENKKIVPECSFVIKAMAQTEEYKDVLSVE